MNYKELLKLNDMIKNIMNLEIEPIDLNLKETEVLIKGKDFFDKMNEIEPQSRDRILLMLLLYVKSKIKGGK